jgi:prepilin-type processing-associated H-X9-DG protein
LIELLVVIAIIALLMSILMPSLEIIKERTRAVICRSNLHQWALVFDVFLAENHGKFMSGYEWEELMDQPSGTGEEGAIDDGGDHSWPLILLEHYKSRKLLCCPVAAKPPPDMRGQRTRSDHVRSTWVAWLYYPDDYFYGSYGINSWVYNRGGETERWKRMPVKRLHNIPMFLDCYWTEGYPHHYNEPPAWNYYGEFGDSDEHMKRFCLDRHNGATNALFMDFSVRPVGLKELWRLRWHRAWPLRAPLPAWPEWMQHLKEPGY